MSRIRDRLEVFRYFNEIVLTGAPTPDERPSVAENAPLRNGVSRGNATEGARGDLCDRCGGDIELCGHDQVIK